MITTRVAELVIEKGKNNKSQLAKELDLNRWTVINLLNNDSPERMDLKTIEKLCRTLNVMPNDLFKITNDDGTLWKPNVTTDD